MATSTDLRAAIEEVQNQLPAEQLEAALPGTQDSGLAARLARRAGALPWWMVSTVLHAVIFLLATLLSVAAPPAQLDEVAITSDVAKQPPPVYDEKKPRDLFRNQTEIQSDQPVEKPMVVHEEAPVAEQFETANESDSHSARGQEDAISDIPLGGTGVTGSMGVGGGGMAGCFGYRDGGGRQHAVRRFGGTPASESAVEAALGWLARHQEADGRWDTSKWDNGQGDVGITGLALLAFLGAGYTSKGPGKYQDNVRRAESWLVANIDKTVNSWSGWEMYERGMATLALAEAYGMTKDQRLLKPAQDAVDYIVAAQGPYEAWNYTPKSGKPGRNDTSVSGWSLMALKSARVAGLKVDANAFQGCMRWLDVATDRSTGTCAYAGTVADPKPGGFWSMTAAALLMRQFMGTPRDDPMAIKAADYLLKHLPRWDAGKAGGGGVNFYYWYYATLCMFQTGGDHWKQWNKDMQTALLPHQRKGGPLDGSAADKDGSWDPVGEGGIPKGGRVFSTALGALTLEVYYRYLPVYAK